MLQHSTYLSRQKSERHWSGDVMGRFALGLCLCCMFEAVTSSVTAQVQIPSNYGQPAAGIPSGYSATGLPPAGIPPTSIPPAASLGPGIQPFDPYALPSANPSLPPPLTGPPPGFNVPSLPAPPPGSAPTWPAPGLSGSATPYGAPPPSAGGVAGGPPTGSNGLPQVGTGPPFRRLFQDTGFRHTWLGGSDGDELQMHDSEFSTTAYFPNFLGSQGPLRVTPGFVFHFLDGPSPPETADLPSRLYSGYVDAGWYPQFAEQFGADINVRAGVFSDFDTVTTHSIRFMGTGVGVIRVNDATALKLGVSYIDRNKVKLLPAAGVLWTPNAQTRWDIFFPAPKLATYWKTVGNSQLWWYLGAEYGGGAWTISREEAPDAGASERIDINDIRVLVGLEWHNLNRWYGFIEGGYVFDREIYYVVVPGDRTKLDNTFMLRGGVSW